MTKRQWAYTRRVTRRQRSFMRSMGGGRMSNLLAVFFIVLFLLVMCGN